MSIMWTKLVILISVTFLMHLPLSHSVSTIQFDDYGNKYIRKRVNPNESKIYQVSFDDNSGDDDDEYIYIVGSSEVHYELIHVDTNISIANNLDSRSRPYYMLQPDNTQFLCVQQNEHCKFNLIVTNEGSSARSIWIRFNKNIIIKPNKMYSNTMKIRKKRRYGMKISNSMLPVLVKLIPNQNYETMDLDLYGYTEKDFTSYYYPNRAERNHIHNYVEQILITSVDSYYTDGRWNFFEVYGSTDSEYNDMEYEFQVITNYEHNFLLKKILLIFAFTIATSFICGIILSFLCTFRHQILFCLRIRRTPHRNGASRKQIKKLQIVSYQTAMSQNVVDSNQCIICLEEYQNEDKIRILKCGHCFHQNCSDEWLYRSTVCPLCNQNISDAVDVHNNNDINNNINVISGHKAEIEMVEMMELQSGPSVQ